jgi:hypothetical protein
MYIAIISGYCVLVDDEDAHLLDKYRWRVQSQTKCHRTHRYVVAWGEGRRLLLLHREIAGAVKGQVVDHKNHDTLDNRRENVRVCSISENLSNRSKANRITSSHHLGVWLESRDRRKVWYACVTFGGKRVRARFYTEAEAVAWRNLTAARIHGEFANISSPQPLLQAFKYFPCVHMATVSYSSNNLSRA